MISPSAVVTGATGFIGTHLVNHLIAEHWDVTVLVRDAKGPMPIGVKVIVDSPADTTGKQLAAALSTTKPDVVFHLASLFLAAHKPEDVPRLIESNILFGTRLLEAMKQAGITKFVNTGTAWQHFEDRADSPVNLYAATKSAFESILDYYREAMPMSMITLKLFDTYGDNDPRLKLVYHLMNAAKSGEHLALSPGEQKIDLVHVDDAVAAFRMAGERLLATDPPHGEQFAVSSGRILSLRKLVELFEKAASKKVDAGWGERPYREREVMTPYSVGKPLPGWKPKVKLEDGLRKAYEAFSK